MKLRGVGLILGSVVSCAGQATVVAPAGALVTSAPVDAGATSLTTQDVKSMLESEVGFLVLLREKTFANQDSIPLQIEGVVGDGPPFLFEKPVVRTADYVKSAIDGDLCTAVLFSLSDQAGDSFRVKISRSWGCGSENVEAWVTQESGTWRVVEVLWKMTAL